MASETLAQGLADWVQGLSPADIPDAATAVAKRCILDTIGVGLAGTSRPIAARTVTYAQAHYGKGTATYLRGGVSGDAAGAAFANGVAAHGLDFDDTCYAGVVHGSAVIFPAVLAAAEESDASGTELLTAFVAGAETAYALGAALGTRLFDRGWFPTGCLGAVGAAAGAAKAIGCGPERIGRAIVLAACQASGLRVILGSDAKPYSAGRAAQLGIEAARFSEQEMSVPWDVFEGHNGTFALLAGGAAEPDLARTPGRPYRLLEPGIAIKRFPLCSSAHPPLDALESLIQEHGLTGDDITSVTCELAPLAVASLPIRRPATVAEAQFSLPFAIACRLVFGGVTVGLLSDETLTDPRLAPVMNRVALGPVFEDVDSGEFPEAARVTVASVDGTTLTATALAPRGDPRNPLSQAELEAKFLSAATGPGTGVSPAVAQDILQRVENLEALAARDLLAPLRGAVGAG